MRYVVRTILTIIVLLLCASQGGAAAKLTSLCGFYPEAEADEKFVLVDQTEMFLGAYEEGKLVFSFPVAVGIEGHRVPNGEFRIDAIDRRHTSNMYTVEEIGRRYPMHYGLRFFCGQDPSYNAFLLYPWSRRARLPRFPRLYRTL